MKSYLWNFVLAAVVAVLFVPGRTCYAVLVAYDGFDYTANTDINGQNGGTGWPAAWANVGAGTTRQVRAPGSTYSVLETVGNKAFIQGSTGGVVRLPPSPIGAGDETIWLSFIGQRDPAGPTDAGRFFSLTLYDGGTASGNERLSIGENSGNTNDLWGMHFTSGATGRQEIAGASIYSETFLLARVNYHAGANDDIYLWANYDLNLGEPTTATAQAMSVGAFNLAFDRVTLRAGAASGGLLSAQGFFDEIRIGTTYADVTPGGVVCDLGDVNCDTIIDVENDFEAIRLHFRRSVTSREDGDLTGDMVVDFDDFREWKVAFLGGGGSLEGVHLNFLTAPEPSSICLALIAALAAVARRGPRHRDAL